MENGFVLEVCVESLARAQASERGGAQRIELCSNLSIGGTTPSAGMMQTARKDVRIPIYVLIRPRGGDFVYSDREFETMKRDICIVKELGMDGIVLGVLNEKRCVDVKRTGELVKLAHPLPVTFHHAFDLCHRPVASLQAVVDTGTRRLLTSGGRAKATDGLANLARLVAVAEDRIVIMPGGGVRASNVKRILCQTRAREIHSSLGTSRTLADSRSDIAGGTHRPKSRLAGDFEARVRKFRQLLDTLPSS